MIQVSMQIAYFGKVVVGDFNGDGKLDMAGEYAYYDTGVLLGNGDGTFKPPSATIPGTPSDIAAVGDFNGDGRLDLALEVNGGVSVVLGNGNGTFQAPLPPTATDDSSHNFLTTAAADFNGDGKLDIAGVNQNSNPGTVGIMLGKGDGTFLPPVDYRAGGGGGAITAADFNHDGKPDVATTTSNSVNVLIGNSDGTFKPMQSFAANVYFYSNAITNGDFNGDGKLDVVVSNQNGVALLLGNGDGTFQPEKDYSIGSGIPSTSLATADFNADGLADVAAIHNSAVAIFLGKSDGTLVGAFDFPDGVGPTVPRIGDFNRDGKPDILTGEGYNIGPNVILNTLPDACFGCTNPIISDGALCNDGNTCTNGDTCRNHVCVGSSLPDGSSCSTRPNASGTCTTGTATIAALQALPIAAAPAPES